MIDGSVELFVLEGKSIFHDQNYGSGTYLRVEKGAKSDPKTDSGCKILVTCRADLYYK